MIRFLLILILLIGVLLGGYTLLNRDDEADVGAHTQLMPTMQTSSFGFARAIEPYDWEFPADHGAHPEFQTEWWYYTGNLAAENGQRFGFQFTIFRRALTPFEPVSDSEWRTNQVYLAHFTVTDVAGNRFFQEQRINRGAADLAGASVDPVYRVWVDDWQIKGISATQTRITAEASDFSVDLRLEPGKPPALQGEQGLSAKSAEPGNASYYYSQSRLSTEGSMTVNGKTYTVSGATWMDHEFSSGALSDQTQGWDWFGLQLDDGRELMVGQIRLVDGDKDPAFSGLLVEADGSTRLLAAADFTITATGTWTSPHNGAVYPSGWEIRVDIGEAEPLELTLTPLILDQELTEGNVYWEGAVRIEGDATGYGYAELTGYLNAMRGRF